MNNKHATFYTTAYFFPSMENAVLTQVPSNLWICTPQETHQEIIEILNDDRQKTEPTQEIPSENSKEVTIQTDVSKYSSSRMDQFFTKLNRYDDKLPCPDVRKSRNFTAI